MDRLWEAAGVPEEVLVSEKVGQLHGPVNHLLVSQFCPAAIDELAGDDHANADVHGDVLLQVAAVVS